ncbi:MAG: type 1 glutamine amidotransferase, partial [Solirubrobacteraceae bacterium]
MRVLGVLHPGAGDGGLLAERAAAAGHVLAPWVPAASERIPGPLRSFGAVVAFGGGMNVHDAGRLPWLGAEIEVLCDALQAR